MKCPACGRDCGRDSADVGVGVIYGPWGCACGWSEWDDLDQRSGVVWDGDDRVIDQYGVSHSVDRLDGAAVRAAAGEYIGVEACPGCGMQECTCTR